MKKNLLGNKSFRNKVIAGVMIFTTGMCLLNGSKIVQGYSDSNIAKGWKLEDNNWYYYTSLTSVAKGWQDIDGNWYYMDDNGVVQNGWIEKDGVEYFLRGKDVNDIGYGSLVKGRCKIDDNWYFFNGSGELQTGEYENEGKTYYSDENGVMVFGKWIDTANGKRYVKDDGSYATEDTIINGTLEKFESSGNYIGKGELSEYLYVKHLTVGNADCTYIKLPNGETVLIDTGDTSESSKKTIIDFLKTQNLKEVDGVPTIDYIVISHAHSDHIGGLSEILKEFSAGKVYIPEVGKMKDWYSGLKADGQTILQSDIDMVKLDYDVYVEAENAVKTRNLEFTNTVRGKYIDSENILKFVESDKDYGSVGSQEHLGEYWGLNDNSAVVYLNYGDFQELFTGDIEWTAEAEIVKDDLLSGGEVDVLKVPHHGYQTSSTVGFDQYLNATIGIISRSESEIAENQVAVNNLEFTGTRIVEVSSSKNGGIEIWATKKSWSVNS